MPSLFNDACLRVSPEVGYIVPCVCFINNKSHVYLTFVTQFGCRRILFSFGAISAGILAFLLERQPPF
ncbi:hypothetical protein FKM82_021376 [Ascaphus truei]